MRMEAILFGLLVFVGLVGWLEIGCRGGLGDMRESREWLIMMVVK